MPFTKNSIWVHIIFSTKDRIPYLSWEIRTEICEWIKHEAVKKEIHIDIVNGVKDHLHLLVKLKTKQSVSEIVKWTKGASSHYLNKNHRWNPKFAWQQGYAVYSISENDIKKVRSYIYNQETRHKAQNTRL